MQRLVELARSGTVDQFISAAELAEITEDDCFFGPLTVDHRPAEPPNAFYILLSLAYMQTADFVLAETTLLRWRCQLSDTEAPPPPLTPARPIKALPAAVACAGLLAVCRQCLRHFYDVGFDKMRVLTTSSAVDNTTAASPDFANDDGEDGGSLVAAAASSTISVSVADPTEVAAAVMVYTEGCLDSLAARHVRLHSSLHGSGGCSSGIRTSASTTPDAEGADVQEAAAMLSITVEELKRRLAADKSRKAVRAAAREAVLAKSVESTSLVDAALRVGAFA